MLDFLGFIATGTLLVLVVSAVLVFMDASRGAKLILAGIAGLWIGLCAAAGNAGWIAIARPFPVVGFFVVAPLVAAAIAAAWPAARRAMLSLPMPLLIGLNIGRVFAVLFLLLWAERRLAGPFPFSAALGDIITGVLAVPLIWLAQDGGAKHANAITAWNWFGAADLVLAIALGAASAEGSPVQVIHAPPGSEAMQYLPWSFVPTALVPFWLIIHAIVFAQLRQRAKSGGPAMATA